MATPYAPELTSPAYRAAVAGGAVALKFRYYHPSPGKAGNAYAVRRRSMSGVVGAYEYWNGTTWVGTVQWVALSMTHGLEYTVTPTGFSNNVIYQWSIACRDTDNDIGPFAQDGLIDAHAAPTTTINAPSGAQVADDPEIRWQWVSAANKRQGGYQLAVYRSNRYLDANFNPELAIWQSLSEWSMDEIHYSTQDWSRRSSFTLEPGITYRAYGKFVDENGLSSGWIAGPDFTNSVVRPDPPTVTATVNLEAGNVEFLMGYSANLLPDNMSSFEDMNNHELPSGWSGIHNCSVETRSQYWMLLNNPGNPGYSTDYGVGEEEFTLDFSPVTGDHYGYVKVSGKTFAQMDADYGTFTNEDSAFASFGAQANAQASPVLEAYFTTPTGSSGIVVGPTLPHSAIGHINPVQTGGVARLRIYWWKANGTASTTPFTDGPTVALDSLGWKEIEVQNAVSPADAAFASLEVRLTSAAIGNEYYADAFVFVQKAEAVWAGSVPSYGFIVERLEGSRWVPVWGASKDEPFRPQGAGNSALVVDRDPPINSPDDLVYRVIMAGLNSSGWAMSTPQIVEVPRISADSWWMKSFDTDEFDTRIVATSRQDSWSPIATDLSAQGKRDKTVYYTEGPADETFEIEILAYDNETSMAIASMLRTLGRFMIQTNRRGERLYGVTKQGYKRTQIRAQPTEGEVAENQVVRTVFRYSFQLITVERPS